MIYRLVICLLFLLIAGQWSWGQVAQKTGDISGKVIDAKTGETLIGVVAVVDGNQSTATLSDVDGHFVCSKVTAGAHTLQLRYVGYKISETQVQVKAGEVVAVQAAMEEAVSYTHLTLPTKA